MSRTHYTFLSDDDAPYFITATTVNWLPLFSNPEIASILIDSLRFLICNGRIRIFAYVIMENHIHLIATSAHLSREITAFKSFTARQSIAHYQEHHNQFTLNLLAQSKLPHKTDRQYQFWQEGSHPQRIESESVLHQKIEYIHHNPVKRGYVDLPEQWRYSSARNYAGLEGVLPVDWLDDGMENAER